jgi:hypothetical protein
VILVTFHMGRRGNSLCGSFVEAVEPDLFDIRRSALKSDELGLGRDVNRQNSVSVPDRGQPVQKKA